MTYIGKPATGNRISLWTGDRFTDAFYNSGSSTNTVSFSQLNKLPVNTYSPRAVFLFNNNIEDSSGNGNNLTTDTGNVLYTTGRQVGSRSMYFDGATRIKAVASQSFFSTSSLTLQGVFCFIESPSATKTFIEFAGNGETEATNILYSLALSTTDKVIYEHESGSAATNVPLTFTSYSVLLNEWMHLAYTRDSAGTTHKLYINGLLADQTFNASPPTAAAAYTSNFYLGGAVSATEYVQFYCDSLKVHNIELTAQQIYNEYSSVFKTEINSYLPTTIKQTIASYASTSAGIGSPDTLGAVNSNPNEFRNQSIILSSILSTTVATNTGSIKLYNVTSGSYVHLIGTSVSMSTNSTSPTRLTSSNLLSQTNFSTGSAVYRLEYYGEGTTPTTIHYNSEFIST